MRIVMMGTGTFAEPTFAALLASSHQVAGLVTQPDRPVGQERGSTRQTGQGMKSIAQKHNVPVFQPESVNTPEGLAGVQGFQPELLVVAAYGQILSRDVLSAAPLGGINVHASLLPKYRGAAPVAWAIYHGETRTGISIIRMSTALDAGDILAQETIDILPDETAGELEARLAPLGARLALETIAKLKQGPISGTKQDKALVTKAPKLKKEDGLIDWSRPPGCVSDQILAMQPWPTAYTYLHRSGKEPVRIMIVRTGGMIVAEDDPRWPVPGTLHRREGSNLWVATGAIGAIEILELQPAGKKRMSAEEFLRGHPIRQGDPFRQE